VLDDASVVTPTGPGVPRDADDAPAPGAGPAQPGADGDAPAHAGLAAEGSQGAVEAGDSAAGGPVEPTAGAGGRVRAASAVPALARTGFAAEAALLGLLALLAGLGLHVASRRSDASTRR
jgi:hypothetical protein